MIIVNILSAIYIYLLLYNLLMWRCCLSNLVTLGTLGYSLIVSFIIRSKYFIDLRSAMVASLSLSPNIEYNSFLAEFYSTN